MEQFPLGTDPKSSLQFSVWWKCIAFNIMCIVMLLILLEGNNEHKNAVLLWYHTYKK